MHKDTIRAFVVMYYVISSYQVSEERLTFARSSCLSKNRRRWTAHEMGLRTHREMTYNLKQVIQDEKKQREEEMDFKDAASSLEWSTAERRFQSSSKNEYSNQRQDMLLSDANRRNRLTETWIELQIKHMAASSVEVDV
jgi:rubrerythrin